MKSRLTHALTFLIALSTAVAPAWSDPQQTWPYRVAITAVIALLLGISTEKLASARNAIIGAVAVAASVIAVVYGRLTPGTAGFAVTGFVAAVITQMRILLPQKLPPVTISGAGATGGDYAGTIVSANGTSIVVAPATATSVSSDPSRPIDVKPRVLAMLLIGLGALAYSAAAAS